MESDTARWLVAATPAGFERFVATVGRATSEFELPGDVVMPDQDEFERICSSFETSS